MYDVYSKARGKTEKLQIITILRILFVPVVALFSSFIFVAEQLNVKLLFFAPNSCFEVVIA